MKEIKLDLKPLIKKLEVFTKRQVRGKFSGEYKSQFKGRGLEFEGYRRYESGHDDASTIDWRASLRAGKILTKVLVEERNISVYILMDASNSMLFASTPKLKCEYAAELVSSLAFAGLQSQDSVGMGMFTDDMAFNLKPNMGAKQFYLVNKALSNPSFYGGNFDLEKALKFATEFVERDSLLFIVSDFIGLDGGWKDWLEVCSRKYDMLVFMVRDPLDDEIPVNVDQVVVGDPYSHQDLLIDPDLIRESYAAEAKKRKEEIKKEFTRLSIDAIELRTDKDFVHPILALFERRKKRG